MKLAALVPALFVLVSMCGSPVPPPPGAVSGVIFYDINRNSIHDSCDSSLAQVRVVARSADGTTAEAKTNNDGTFHIAEVPTGDVVVALPANDGYVWPITTLPEGSSGVGVNVKSNEESARVEIGSASRSAFVNSSVSILGMVFHDANNNGVVDPNECGRRENNNFEDQWVRVNQGAYVHVSSNGTFELRDVGKRGVNVVLNEAPVITFLSGPYTDLDIPDDHPCLMQATPQRRYSANLFSANIAIAGGKRTGTVSGRIFDDVNDNGVRDASEPGIARQAVYLNADGPTCGSGSNNFYNPSTGTTDQDGAFTVNNVPMGVYTIQLGGPKDLPPTAETPATTITIQRWSYDLRVSVLNNKATKVDLPLWIEQPSTIRVLVFDDADGDGAQSAGEEPIDGYTICARRSPQEEVNNQGYYQYDQTCGMTDTEGVALLGPLVSGHYNIPDASNYYGPVANDPVRAPPATRLVDLAEGEQLDVSLPLEVIPAEEQVIPPGAGTPVTFENCFTDPDWMLPPFEDGYARVFPFDGGPPQGEMRNIYERGIYTGTSGDLYTWSAIAGEGDWSSLVPGCVNAPDYNDAVRLFVFVNYEPIAITASDSVAQGVFVPGIAPPPPISPDNVLQFALRPKPAGLYAILLPSDFPITPNGAWYLFVDEGLNPILRLSAYGSYGPVTIGR